MHGKKMTGGGHKGPPPPPHGIRVKLILRMFEVVSLMSVVRILHFLFWASYDWGRGGGGGPQRPPFRSWPRSGRLLQYLARASEIAQIKRPRFYFSQQGQRQAGSRLLSARFIFKQLAGNGFKFKVPLLLKNDYKKYI